MLKAKRIGKESFENMTNLISNKTPEKVHDAKNFILVVSDDSETRLLLKTLLELWKFRTIESPNVGDAEDLSGFFPPQLILLDTNASFNEALQNICLIRQNELFSGLPLIVISGYAEPHYHNLAISNGADVFLTKPLNFAKMEGIMKKLITNGVVI